ncbi:TAP-like protein-domain-containing protein [Bisporella sp. PMI_857]|nr:TAP-like protein-domain-containing protein [Bisporella sp. PMI_857]
MPTLNVKENGTQQWSFEQITPSRNLVWYPCLSKYSCAMLDVALDYSKPNGTRAAIPLIKISAQINSSSSAYQGMILVNPGGPGESGVDFILREGYSDLQSVIGTNFDIVSFDPRGMGRSIPLANCSASSTSPLRRRAYGISGPTLPAAFWDETLASYKTFGQQCEAAIGGPDGAGQHMSTPVVATDMLSIVDAFTATERGKSVMDSSLLNYWGFSYGTFLGQTFASMYPNRVGRFAIDGVADPEDYITGADVSDIIVADAAVVSFFEYCYLAGPIACPFYIGSSAQDIHTRFANIFAQLNASHAISQNWANATLITQALALIKFTLKVDIYTPITYFPAMAQQLVGFESAIQNLTIEGIMAASTLGVPMAGVPGTVAPLDEWTIGVVCSERPSVFNQNTTDFESHLAELEGQSFILGEFFNFVKAPCAGWPIRATWRYAGPFGGSTKNPILFVSNTVDPATPLVNSQRWSPRFEGSRVLTIEAVGHMSLAAKNTCANEKIGKFFQTGELPERGTVCKVEKGPFGVVLQSLSDFTGTTPSGLTNGTAYSSAASVKNIANGLLGIGILIAGIS